MGNSSALLAAPVVDSTYVNINLQIDPTWYALGAFGNQSNPPIQFIYTGLTVIFCNIGDEGFTENVGVNYATSNVLRAAEQYKTFIETANREIQITFYFVTQEQWTDNASAGQFLEAGGLGYNGKGGVFYETVWPARWIPIL